VECGIRLPSGVETLKGFTSDQLKAAAEAADAQHELVRKALGRPLGYEIGQVIEAVYPDTALTGLVKGFDGDVIILHIDSGRREVHSTDNMQTVRVIEKNARFIRTLEHSGFDGYWANISAFSAPLPKGVIDLMEDQLAIGEMATRAYGDGDRAAAVDRCTHIPSLMKNCLNLSDRHTTLSSSSVRCQTPEAGKCCYKHRSLNRLISLIDDDDERDAKLVEIALAEDCGGEARPQILLRITRALTLVKAVVGLYGRSQEGRGSLLLDCPKFDKEDENDVLTILFDPTFVREDYRVEVEEGLLEMQNREYPMTIVSGHHPRYGECLITEINRQLDQQPSVLSDEGWADADRQASFIHVSNMLRNSGQCFQRMTPELRLLILKLIEAPSPSSNPNFKPNHLRMFFKLHRLIDPELCTLIEDLVAKAGRAIRESEASSSTPPWAEAYMGSAWDKRQR